MPPRYILLALAVPVLFSLGCLPLLGGASAKNGFEPPKETFLIPAVPFIPDDSSHCGPSTLAAVMTYQGRATTKEEVAVDVQRADLRGALGPDMVIWAREKGMDASFSSSRPEDLIGAIRSRKPVIVLLDMGIGPIRKGHFAVALGFGPEGLVLNSGEFQQLVIPWKDFLQDWRKMGNFAIFVNGLASPQPTARDGAQGNHGGLQAPVKSHEVLDPAKIPQSLNLPVGLDLPSDMAETVPARRPVPLGQPKNAPAFLTGVALPSPSGNLEQPVVDMSLSGPAPSPDPDGEAHEDAHAQPHSDLQGVAQAKGQGRASERKAAAGPVPGGLSIVMESLPLPDEGPSFTQSDVGTPLALPVVPLPEEQPIAGELIGSDFKGPATVPGARTPSQAMGAQAAAANGQQAPPSDQKGAAEPSGARQANAQKPLADGSYGEASGQGWDGVPLILPVVPLPDMATVSGESAAPGSGEPAVPAPKGTAVTTGSLAPSQAGRPKKAEGSGASTAMPSEETPVMGWER